MSDHVNESETLSLILRSFSVFNNFRGPSSSGLWWRTDGKYAPVTLMVNCNDVFHWGCSDLERLTPENMGELEGAYADLLAVSPDVAHQADLLFCSRIRKMRPQGAYYEYIEEASLPLFDACGPEREIDFGNPFSREDGIAKAGMYALKPDKFDCLAKLNDRLVTCLSGLIAEISQECGDPDDDETPLDLAIVEAKALVDWIADHPGEGLPDES